MENQKFIYGKVNPFEGKEMYAILPNNIVWNYDPESKEHYVTLKNQLEYQFAIPCLYYLYGNLNLRGFTTFSISELIVNCGYTVEKDVIKKFKDLLSRLKAIGILDCEEDLSKIKLNEHIIADLNLGIVSNYFVIYNNQFATIMNEEKYSATEKCNAFTFLCYVIARIEKGKREEGKIDDSYCYFHIERAVKDLSLSKGTVTKCIDILKELRLLLIGNVGYLKKSKKQCMNIYALTKEGLYKGMSYSYNFYSEGFDDFIPSIKKPE